jgi:UDP-N-acetylglucosamine:LPS N-acetylglucosamine transferase
MSIRRARCRKGLKILLASSAGGHLSQLLKLSRSWSGFETVLITTNDWAIPVSERHCAAYVVGECNRGNLLKVILVFWRSLRIVLRERPDIVISTGAAAGAIASAISKLFGAKIVWVDSIANVKRVSLSGRLVRRFADLFLVQWPHLQNKSLNIEYAGALV